MEESAVTIAINTGKSLLPYTLAAGLTFRITNEGRAGGFLEVPQDNRKSLHSLESDWSQFYVGCKSDLAAALQMLQQYFNKLYIFFPN